MITKIELTFSKLFLYGESGKLGNATVFPVFIEVYLDSGFIVSRAKAKSTLYEYSDTNEFLTNEYRVDTMRYAMSIVDQVCALLGFETAADPRAAKSEIERALYGIYNKNCCMQCGFNIYGLIQSQFKLELRDYLENESLLSRWSNQKGTGWIDHL